MPCQSYEQDRYYENRRLQSLMDLNDKLARIACRALSTLEAIQELPKQTKSTLNQIKAALSESETSIWWEKHKADDLAEKLKLTNEQEKQDKLLALKKSAYSKLSKDEISALGSEAIKEFKKLLDN